MARLSAREERGNHGGLTPRTVTPSTSSTSTAGPSTSESFGRTDTFSARLWQVRSSSSSSLSSIARG